MHGISTFSIDITTLAMLRGIVQIMLGGLLLYLGSHHTDARDARWWAAGFVINGISLFVFPFNVPEAWQVPRTVINHLTLGASWLFFLIGFWKFSQQPLRPWLLVVLMAFPIISLTAWEILWPNARYRVLFTATGQVIYLLALQYTLSLPPRNELAGIYRRLRYAVIIYTLVFICSYASITNLLPTSAYQALNYHHSIFSVSSLLFMLTLAVGCLALQFTLLAVHNADLAMRDWLTGLFNRRGFFHAIQAAQQVTKAPQSPTSILAIDIDHFKKINDQYGHSNGDLVLQTFSQQLRALESPDNLIARMGGEEFVLVLFNTDLHDAAKLADTIRQHAEAEQVNTSKGQVLRFTISIGIYAVSSQEHIEQALAHADEALYVAKTNGRNQVASLPVGPVAPEKRTFRSANRTDNL